MNETQIEKKAQRKANRIDQFQQRKRAEELTNGMVLRNAALEQLATKSKKKRSSRSLQKLKVKKPLLGLPNVLNKNNSIPHLLRLFSVSLALQAPHAVKMEKQENRDHDISDRDTKQRCAMIREQPAKELARIGMANNAARRHRAMAVLKSALAKQRDKGGEKNIRRLM